MIKKLLISTFKDTGKISQLPEDLQWCPTFWHLWATLEEELSWATH